MTWALLLPAAQAAEPIERFDEQLIYAQESNHNWYARDDMELGDLNGDGHADLAVASWGIGWSATYVYLGSADGLDLASETMWTVPSQLHWSAASPGDLNGDGFGELAVGQGGRADGDRRGLLHIVPGSEVGPIWAEALPFVPEVEHETRSAFSASIAGAGDVNGDGLADLIVGDWEYTEGNVTPGAAYVYLGDPAGLSSASESFLENPIGDDGAACGANVQGVGDLDADGYADVGVQCRVRDIVYLWSGSVDGAHGDHRAHVEPSDHPAVNYDNFGGRMTAGDLDGDGFDDIAAGAWHGLYAFYGGPDWELQPTETKFFAEELDDSWYGVFVQFVGDQDGDGYDDLAAGAESYGDEEVLVPVRLYWGGEEGLSLHSPYTELVNENGLIGTALGSLGKAAGDVDGDGRFEIAVGAGYETAPNGELGVVHVFSAVCDWYQDADGDGYGDPEVHIEDCQHVEGYAGNAHDCDDQDPDVHGGIWYLDQDGDGWGTQAGRTLACEQPPGASTSWLDCDDTDASVHPEAPEIPEDGVDQDCDGVDAPRSDSGPLDSVPSDTSPGDSRQTQDSDAPERPRGERRRCGCQGNRSAALGLLALGALLLARRRRYSR